MLASSDSDASDDDVTATPTPASNPHRPYPGMLMSHGLRCTLLHRVLRYPRLFRTTVSRLPEADNACSMWLCHVCKKALIVRFQITVSRLQQAPMFVSCGCFKFADKRPMGMSGARTERSTLPPQRNVAQPSRDRPQKPAPSRLVQQIGQATNQQQGGRAPANANGALQAGRKRNAQPDSRYGMLEPGTICP